MGLLKRFRAKCWRTSADNPRFIETLPATAPRFICPVESSRRRDRKSG